jgi:hypothetical protein
MSDSLPKQVIIIRHGEKLGDPATDKGGGPELSIRGSARAAALPGLFVPAGPTELSCQLAGTSASFSAQYGTVNLKGTRPRFATPDFIFATAPSTHSNRPIETITPTATALQLAINSGSSGFPDTEAGVKQLVDLITTGQTYAGKIVVICWHHGQIPDLAAKLGVAKPPKWRGTDFDSVWIITFPKGKAKLAKHKQKLLYGDK